LFFLAEEDEDENEDQEIRKKKGHIGKIIIDPSGKQVKSGRIECCRNVAEYQLPSGLSFAQLEALERDLVSSLEDCDRRDATDNDDEEEDKSYYSMAEVLEENSEIKDKLEASNLLVMLTNDQENEENLLHGYHWPHGRGVFLMRDGNMAIWVNVQEHLRVVSSTPKGNPSSLGEAYNRLAHLMMDLETMFEFKTDPLLGHLTACPSALGNSLHIYLTAHLPKLGQEEDKLQRLCSARGLNIKKRPEGEDMFNIWNQQSLSITEHQTLKDFSTAASNVIQLESNHSKKSKK
jgi:protein-arginine kinase